MEISGDLPANSENQHSDFCYNQGKLFVSRRWNNKRLFSRWRKIWLNSARISTTAYSLASEDLIRFDVCANHRVNWSNKNFRKDKEHSFFILWVDCKLELFVILFINPEVKWFEDFFRWENKVYRRIFFLKNTKIFAGILSLFSKIHQNFTRIEFFFIGSKI